MPQFPSRARLTRKAHEPQRHHLSVRKGPLGVRSLPKLHWQTPRATRHQAAVHDIKVTHATSLPPGGRRSTFTSLEDGGSCHPAPACRCTLRADPAMRCGCEWHASLRSHEEHASGASVEAADPAVAAVSALRGYRKYTYTPWCTEHARGREGAWDWAMNSVSSLGGRHMHLEAAARKHGSDVT